MCRWWISRNLGFEINCDDEIRKDAFLFGEAQSRVVVSVKPENQENFVEFMAGHQADFSLLGEVKGACAVIDGENFGLITEMKTIFDNSLGEILA